jgi:hypothetical protein
MRSQPIRRFFLAITLVTSLLIGVFASTVSNAQQFGTGWTGSYYNDPNFTGSPVITRADSQINFNFGTSSPVAGFVNADNFSIRWTSTQNLTAGTYRFTAVADDGIRVTVNGQVIIDKLVSTGTLQTATADVVLPGGNTTFQVDYVELVNNAAVQFYWDVAGASGPTQTAGPTATITQTSVPAIPAGAITATVIRASVLNVREAPSLGGNLLGRILRGQTYAIVGRNQNATWFLLQLSGRQAWAWGYYLYINGNEFNPPVVSGSSVLGLPGGVQDTGVIVQTQAGLRLRSAPTVNSAQTGRIGWGSFLPVVARSVDGVWLQVVWKGTVGWVARGYVEPFQGDLNSVPITQ